MPKLKNTTVSKKAEATRLAILQQAFSRIYKNGYRTTSIDDIIATTQVTKGAFFYHFSNKDEMALAMIKEVMLPGMEKAMTEPLINAANPVEEIYVMMRGLLTGNTFFIVKYGCPAINLIEEMSSQNEAFNEALSTLTDKWRDALVNCIENGRAAGKIKPEASAKAIATHIMAGYAGIRNLGKLYGSSAYNDFLDSFRQYLQSLKP